MGDERRGGERPVIQIRAKTIPEAWETAMKRVWTEGISRETQYDKAGDPPSKDAHVIIQVTEPFAQPRFHRAFADGLGGMAEYVQEVVNGAHDYWLRSPKDILAEVAKGVRADPKWTYTYHQRLFNQPQQDGSTINQIEAMAQGLAKNPHSRRIQAITYVPWIDSKIDDPPCLQRVWARAFEDEEKKLHLNMDTSWRSRDLFKAWFENTIALTTLQAKLAKRIEELRGEPIFIGPYTDSSNSLHIYGSYFHAIEGDSEKGLKNFFEHLKERPFSSDSMNNAASRTYTSNQVKEFFIDDGVGKGLERMLERERNEMPEETQGKIAKDLMALKDGSFIP